MTEDEEDASKPQGLEAEQELYDRVEKEAAELGYELEFVNRYELVDRRNNHTVGGWTLLKDLREDLSRVRLGMRFE
jgi:hypothetical protein